MARGGRAVSRPCSRQPSDQRPGFICALAGRVEVVETSCGRTRFPHWPMTACVKLEAPSADLRAEFLDMAADFASHGESRYVPASQDFEGFLRRLASDEQER